LHGRERTKKEMLDLAAQIDLPGFRWLAPYAESGKWYPGRFMDPLARNEPYLTRAVERCDRVVEEAGENGRLGPDKLAVLGFSQGACIAAEYALRRPGRCGAVVVFTGALMGAPDAPRHGDLKGLPIFISGSDADEWITEAATRRSAEVLAQLGASVTLRIYRGRPHIVAEEEIADAREFLKSSLNLLR
jgi:phospholipase/carboxylesterase